MPKPVIERPALTALAGGVLLLLVSAADYLSGPDITFSLFYLLIVAFVAWTARNLRFATAAAIVCAVVWLVAEWYTSGAPRATILLWNAVSRLAILVTIGMLIARLRRAHDAEKTLARRDFLTGALNARALAELMRIEVTRARRFRRPLALAYVDLDDFKGVNDRFGHGQGDHVLREVANVLKANVRETDTVARPGGDEFVVLLPETTGRDAETVVGKLQQALTATMQGRDWPVTFSIGVAAYAVPPADVDQLMNAADAVMYQAKADGKNRVRFHSDPAA